MNTLQTESPNLTDWNLVEKLLGSWRDTIGTIQNAHYTSAIHTERLNLIIGIPVIIFTGIISSAVFGDLQNSVPAPYKIALGTLGLIASFLASLQTFLTLKIVPKNIALAE